MSILGFFLALVAGPDAAQAPAAIEPPPVEDIVVTGFRGTGRRRVRPDAVEILRAHCFEPARLTRRFEEPSPGPRWIELDEGERRQFRVQDPAVPAYGMADESRGHHLWLKFERFRYRSDTEEQRCTLLVIGGRDHERFVGDMSSLFRGPATQRHVGERDGSPAIAGWEQWLWTGMPSRGSKSWKRTEPRRGSAPTWLVVVDLQGFYNSYDYILGDMKSRKGPGTALTMLTFSLTTRPPRQAAAKRRSPAAELLPSSGVEPPR